MLSVLAVNVSVGNGLSSAYKQVHGYDRPIGIATYNATKRRTSYCAQSLQPQLQSRRCHPLGFQAQSDIMSRASES